MPLSTGRAGGDASALGLLFIAAVSAVVLGGVGWYLLVHRRCCCGGDEAAGRGGALADADWTAAGAGDTWGGEELGSGGQAAPLGVMGRLRMWLRRARRGNVNEGIAMGRTMQFHTLEDF